MRKLLILVLLALALSSCLSANVGVGPGGLHGGVGVYFLILIQLNGKNFLRGEMKWKN